MKKRLLSLCMIISLMIPHTACPLAASEETVLSDMQLDQDEGELTDDLVTGEEWPNEILIMEDESPDSEAILSDETLPASEDAEEKDLVLLPDEGSDILDDSYDMEGKGPTEETGLPEQILLPAAEEQNLLELDSEEEESGEICYLQSMMVNPIYEDVTTDSEIREFEEKMQENLEELMDETAAPEEPVLFQSGKKPLSAQFSSPELMAGNVCTSVEEIGNTLREGLNAHQTSIDVIYSTEENLGVENRINSFLRETMNSAFTHTKRPFEGDSLRWSVGQYGINGSVSQDGDLYLYDFVYTVTYYMDAAQTQTLKETVPEVLDTLGLVGQSPYGMTKTIYGYICDNVTYDYANLNDAEYKLKHTAYAALIDHTAVCQGYAVLLYQMLLSEGIDNRLIAGLGGTEDHAWNIVGVGNAYYNADSTWDAGKNFSDYSWFLKSMSEFPRHSRSDEYLTDVFEAAYPMAPSSLVESGGEPETEPVTEPVTEKITEKVTEQVTEPVTEKVTEKATEQVTEPVTEKTTEPVTEKITEKATEQVTEPVTEKTTEPVTEKVTEPVTEKVTEKVTERVTEPPAEPAGTPETQPPTEAEEEAARPSEPEKTKETEAKTEKQPAPETALRPGKITVGQKTYKRYTHLTRSQSFMISASSIGSGALKFTSSNSKVKVNSIGRVTIPKKFSGKAVITITAPSDRKYQQAYATVTVQVISVQKPAVESLKNSASGTMTVRWKSVPDGSGYEIRIASNKAMTKGTKTITVTGRKKRSKKITGLKKGKRYYMKMRAYKTYQGVKYYSSWSKRKSVKINR